MASDTYTDRRGNVYKRLPTGVHVLLSKREVVRPVDDTPFDITEPQVVDACNVEFGYELIFALPYAYCLHEKGLLKGTISAVDTECLYFFSPDHQINNEPRSWDNMQKASGIPNISIHRPSLNWNKFSPPPLKERYKNKRFVYDKPILCICNRVNVEWGKGVINYFDLPTLEKLFTSLKKHYQIIYFNIEGRKEFYDGVDPVSIGDFDLARKHGAIVIHDLQKENSDLSFNTLQLMVMANSQAFITMNGGYSILASYMGGANIIYSAECKELNPQVNSFYRWYHRFGGSRIIHANTYEDLHKNVDIHFVKKPPVVNIIVRTSNRPNYFESCMRSIQEQTYPNIRVWVGHGESDRYVIPYKVTPVQVVEEKINRPTGRKEDYGTVAPYNNYLNQIKAGIKEGFVMVLDDDDCFSSKTAVKEIVTKLKNNDLAIWRVRFDDKIVPEDSLFKNKGIVRKNISMIGFMCSAETLVDYKFEPYRWADFRVIKHLSRQTKAVWIDKVYTEAQTGACNGGNRKDKE